MARLHFGQFFPCAACGVVGAPFSSNLGKCREAKACRSVPDSARGREQHEEFSCVPSRSPSAKSELSMANRNRVHGFWWVDGSWAVVGSVVRPFVVMVVEGVGMMGGRDRSLETCMVKPGRPGKYSSSKETSR